MVKPEATALGTSQLPAVGVTLSCWHCWVSMHPFRWEHTDFLSRARSGGSGSRISMMLLSSRVGTISPHASLTGHLSRRCPETLLWVRSYPGRHLTRAHRGGGGLRSHRTWVSIPTRISATVSPVCMVAAPVVPTSPCAQGTRGAGLGASRAAQLSTTTVTANAFTGEASQRRGKYLFKELQSHRLLPRTLDKSFSLHKPQSLPL